LLQLFRRKGGDAVEIFTNRYQAGKMLARKLTKYANKADVLILALPRGGVPVAYEVAKALRVALDIFIVRKLGVPFHKELAMGAISLRGATLLNNEIISSLNISQEAIQAVICEEEAELNRRNQLYRQSQEFGSIEGKTIILIDDGLATGSTISVAILALRKLNPAKIIVAVPVGSVENCNALKQQVDEVICLTTPEVFYAVGQAYIDFSQTSDEEVLSLLKEYKLHLEPRRV
jgi:predicted phosphoribosyltransferase